MSQVIFERDGHVATITLNRPARLNAISGPMLMELGRKLIECDADRNVRAVVLTGAGRGFCSGLDLQDVAAGSVPRRGRRCWWATVGPVRATPSRST
ncbi:MAG TPA: enoyl-CoA hydratase/isomerase family protein, partial [Acidothermaceae bacterium]